MDLAVFSTVELSRRGHQTPPQWPTYAGLVAFSCRDVRTCRSDVEHKPIEDELTKNYAHCILMPPLAPENERILADAATLVVEFVPP